MVGTSLTHKREGRDADPPSHDTTHSQRRYEREEPFLSLSLSISTNVMQEALKEFVKGEWLEGDNAYFCEKCQEKVRIA